VPPSPFFLPFLSPASLRRTPPQPGRDCSASPPPHRSFGGGGRRDTARWVVYLGRIPLSFFYLHFMAINRHTPSSLNSPCRYPAPLPVMAADHLWPGRRPPHPSIDPPSLPSFLFKKSSSSRSHLCNRNTPTRTLEASPSHSVAAPSSPPPVKLVAGEGLPLLSLSSSLVFLPASLSLPCHRFAPSTPSRVAPRSRWSAARPAVIELHRRLFPFVCEFA
jgi:hypothetical protein